VWLRNPDLVVLDEATARVDPATEQQISTAVSQLMVGRTTFIIAHRLSTLDMVDEILVFDHGRIVEHGDRSALVDAEDSRFRRLLELALAVEREEGRVADDEGDEDDEGSLVVGKVTRPVEPFGATAGGVGGGGT
jgi:ABC-type multidrug transport system ATPase subunit